MARLADLGLSPPAGIAATAQVRGITADSREVRSGWLFFALKGRLDGAEFAPFAWRQGALAVVADAEGAATARRLAGAAAGAVIEVAEPRLALARAAAGFFDAQPATVAAVTGTNGKTSTAAFLRQIWTGCGRRAVNLGTTGVEGAVVAPGSLTTPDPVRLHALLADLAEAGVSHAAMEASSHGLDQFRLDGVRLAAVGFTNLSRDHLDYHGSMDAYLAAKAGLFSRVAPPGAAAALNADDAAFGVIEAVARARGLRVIGVGRAGADLRLLARDFHPAGQRLRFVWAGRERAADLPLIGGFQGDNALLAAAMAIGAGEAPAMVFAALPGLVPVRGRMELAAVRANGARVYVDYAHTPDALRVALAALRPHMAPGGRLVVVFGAGGDRDRGKRPLMGAAACAGADAVIVTDDNPRSEDPAAIRAEVLAGCPRDPAPEEIGDRAEAILVGVDHLGPRDCLLIAGKGHETGQTVGAETLPFDDAEQARAAVAALDGDEGR